MKWWGLVVGMDEVRHRIRSWYKESKATGFRLVLIKTNESVSTHLPN